MKTVRKLITHAASTLLAAACALPAIAQSYAPAVDFTSLLNMKFYDNGILRFADANLAFAPPNSLDASVEVVSADGKVLGHFDYHYSQSTHSFFAPHQARLAHEAPALTREQLLVDGKYNIRIERQSDGALLRNFVFTVAGGQVQELPRAVLGYQPHETFIVPRVPVYGSSTYEFKPAIWIQDPTR